MTSRTSWRESGWSLWVASAAYIAGSVLVFVGLHFRASGWIHNPMVSETGIGRGYLALLDDRVLESSRWLAGKGSLAGFQNALIFGGALLLAAASYGAFVRLVSRHGRAVPLRRLLGVCVAAAVPLLVAPYLLSADVFSYISYGRIAALYEHNPYVTAPAAFPDDPYYSWVHWKNTTLIYGPVWLYVSWFVSGVAPGLGSGVAGHVLAFKLIALACHLVNGWLVSRLAPRHGTLMAAIYLLNPLLLLEFAGNAHNDALLITLLLAGLYSHSRGRPLPALGFFALAATTKIWALGVAGLYGLGWLREATSGRLALRRLAAGTLVVATVAVLLYGPVWAGARTFIAFSTDAAASRLLNSLSELAAMGPLSDSAARTLGRALFGAACLVLVMRARSRERAVADAGWYAIAFCALGATWYWPWYSATALALTAAVSADVGLRASVALTLSSLWIYITYAIGFPAGATYAGGFGETLHAARSLIVFGPVAVICGSALASTWLEGRGPQPTSTTVAHGQ